MVNKIKLVLGSAAALGVGLLMLTQPAGSQENPQANKLEGAWVAVAPGTPIAWNAVFVPDPSGRRAAIYGSMVVRIPADLMDPDVPYVDSSSDYVGEAVMTGPDSGKLVLVAQGVQKVVPTAAYPFWEKVAFTWTAKGEFKCTSWDKMDVTFQLEDYPTGPDGLPDTSNPPFFSVPGGGQMTRVHN